MNLNCLNFSVKILDKDCLYRLKYLFNFHIKKDFFYYNRLPDYLKVFINELVKKNKAYLIPCKKCSVCLMFKRYDWVRRCMIERQNYQFCYFLTFTFDNEHLSTPYLERRYLSCFFKKLRDYESSPLYNDNFKYFGCGEYGSRTGRKHYHSVLFTDKDLSFDFFIKKTRKGNNIFINEYINSLWNNGYSSITLIDSPAVFKYVCKYSLKGYEGRNNKNVPAPFLGEHLVISRSLGMKADQDWIINNLNSYVPNSFLKNKKGLYYRKLKAYKENKITFNDFSYIKKNETDFYFHLSAIKYDHWLDKIWSNQDYDWKTNWNNYYQVWISCINKFKGDF